MAPEIFYSCYGYTNKVDMWSFGVVLYILLFRKFPFFGENNVGTINLILNKQIRFCSSDTHNVSLLGKKFIKKLLNKNYHSRISAFEAL